MNLFACLFVYNKGWPELKKSTKKIEKSAKTFLILFDNLRRENSLKLKSKMGAKPSYTKKPFEVNYYRGKKIDKYDNYNFSFSKGTIKTIIM